MIETLREKLSSHPWCNHIHYFQLIDSTNNYAKLLAMQGAPNGTIVLADAQTAGRGRLGRSFVSPQAMGIYLSLILRPECKPTELMHLTCAVGVAASQAVDDACDIQPKIKWTNDLILGNRKLGGILTELSVNPATGLVDWVIVGIGINCCQAETDFPPEIREIACSLGIPKQDRAIVAQHLIRRLYEMQNMLFSEKYQIMEHFRRLCITIGQRISLLRGDSVRNGTALSVFDDGSLKVEFDDGTTEVVSSGEVSIRGMYGYL